MEEGDGDEDDSVEHILRVERGFFGVGGEEEGVGAEVPGGDADAPCEEDLVEA